MMIMVIEILQNTEKATVNSIHTLHLLTWNCTDRYFPAEMGLSESAENCNLGSSTMARHVAVPALRGKEGTL